ncbi:MAG: LEA type 2 family protein [Tannerella sp.]|jgi:LEA14-like dessication related protein|nr:LEA type 2 family protein [Tannerella sp.]
MIRKLQTAVPALAAACLLWGCNAAQQLQSAYNLKHCEYTYRSISNLALAGADLSRGVSTLDAVRLLAVLNGGAASIPLDFTLNVDVRNPNPSPAAFSALSYIVEIDGLEFTDGHLEQSFSVGPGETKPLPVRIGVDLARLATTHSRDAVVRIVRNFIGIGSEETRVTVRLKPSFDVGGTVVTSPVYLPVSFSFGGRKQPATPRS